MNKKGSLQDFVLLIVIGFIFTIFAIVGNMVMSNINTELQSNDQISQEGKEILDESTQNIPKFIDNAFLVILVGMTILIFVTGALLNTNPIFFIFAIILLGVIISLGALLSNIYNDAISEGELADSAEDLVVLPFIYENYAFVMLGLGILMIIGLFAKFGGGGF